MARACGVAGTSSQPTPAIRSGELPIRYATLRLTVPIEPVEVAGDRVPVDLRLVGPPRVAVEAGVEVDEPVEVLLGGERRVAVAVDADDLGRDALADLGLVERLGEEHQPRVAVEIDEPGRDDLAGRVDRPPRRLRAFANVPASVSAQPPLPNLNRAGTPGRAGPVDDRPANDPDLRPAHSRTPCPLTTSSHAGLVVPIADQAANEAFRDRPNSAVPLPEVRSADQLAPGSSPPSARCSSSRTDATGEFQ